MAKKNAAQKRKKKKLALIRLSLITMILIAFIFYLTSTLHNHSIKTNAEEVEYIQNNLVIDNLEAKEIPTPFSQEQREYLASFNLSNETLEALTSSSKFNIENMPVYYQISETTLLITP